MQLQINQQQSAINQKNAHIEDLTEQVARKDDNIKFLKETKEEVSRRCSEQIAEIARHSKTCREFENQISDLTYERDQLKHDLQKAETTNDLQNQHKIGLNEKINQLENDVREYQ